MPQKITPAKRRRMLELHRRNVSGAEIMERFEIGDRRTLWRHLRQAEVEEGTQGGAERLVQDALDRHMEEVWDIVGSWLGILCKDGFGRARETLQACRELEERTLFMGVRGHLPYQELWAEYEMWKELLGERLSVAVELLVIAAREGERRTGLRVRNGRHPGPRLTPAFGNPILERLSRRLNGHRHVPLSIVWREIAGLHEPGLCAMCVEGQTVMVVQGVADRQRCEQQYRDVAEACNDVVRQVEELCDQIQDVADRLRRRLETALARRDHVLHRCALCPVSARAILGEAGQQGSP
jgi:hypothetical protein